MTNATDAMRAREASMGKRTVLTLLWLASVGAASWLGYDAGDADGYRQANDDIYDADICGDRKAP